MNRRVYIATGFDNGPRAKHLSGLLRKLGVDTTVEWWDLPIAHESDPAVRSLIANNDLAGIRRADMVVCLMKGDPATFGSSQLGTHGELGAACVLGVPVLMVSPTPRPGPFCVFHRHPAVFARLVTDSLDFVASAVRTRLPSGHGALLQPVHRGPFEWEGDETDV